ncbi:hypothetical protein FOA52_008267 [Chlamydomonas sp. UWO 241]|nr:hypothetical protein FOA52_008267 [Chlamydomonas sp. UWO 241]
MGGPRALAASAGVVRLLGGWGDGAGQLTVLGAWRGCAVAHGHSPAGVRAYSSGKGDDDSGKGEPSLMTKIFEGFRPRSADATPAAAAETGAESNALIPSGPEQKHHKVFVVELTRKPLFPGIYTPVTVTKNERMIKDILEMKKAGGQAFVGAFLVRDDKAAGGADKSGGGAAKRGRRGGKAKDAEASESTAAATSGAAKEAGGGAEGGAAGEGASIARLLEAEDPASRLYETGTFAQVHTILPGDTPDSAQLLLLGHRRIKRGATLSNDPLRVRIQHLKDDPYTSTDILKATSMEIVNTMRDLLHLNPLYGEQFKTLLTLTGSIDLQDMSRLCDAAASLTSADESHLQAVLDQLDVPARSNQVLLLLKKEVELCKLQADIREQVEGKIMKEQRRVLLMEQLKSIKKELGLEKDDKSALVTKFQERWDAKKALAPADACRVVEEELQKLSGLEPVSPEFNVTRTYLEWLTALPWGTQSPEIFDIVHAKEVLDADHYGLEDVKDRILEFIAVSRLRGSAQGKILCLVGPPGVGKTSIGRSVAATLHRKYYRFSVGGLYDVAEIKGHRRTYVGAMPGKLVQCLKLTGTSNPLVLIDEVDKLGRGHTGDPASALLELLDPEQNSGFMDHYLDVPIDLSKVLFMCTANTLDTIPGPLLDRMEVIRLSGYTSDEKRAIARRYLEPACAKEAGVPDGATSLTDDAMTSLIEEYCREAGVRNLKKHLEKVYRKVALQLVRSPDTLHIVEPPAAPAAKTEDADQDETPAQAEAAAKRQPAASKEGSEAAPAAAAPEVEAAAATRTVTYSGTEVVVDKDLLKKFCGPAPFAKDRFYETTPPGVVMGLAWTSMGGATLYVEAANVFGSESKGAMATTGQLGDVFRESATIAQTFARAYLGRVQPGNNALTQRALHVHVPAGATPKDGPSAGVTIATALLSLALNKPVAPDLAMTGEVTLTGRVLPIGGVKEKVLAAKRSGVKTIIFPEANRRDFDELTSELKAGVDPHFVSHFDQIFKLALEYDGPTPAAPPAVPAAPAAPAV